MATTASPVYDTLAQTIASNNGVTISDVLLMNNSKSVAKKTNQHPSMSPVAWSIDLKTYCGGNNANSQIIAEKYSIRPLFSGLNPCPGPENGISYLPIPNSNYALIFYAPSNTNPNYYNKVYCVPARQNPEYVTGFEEFKTAVPEDFVPAFVRYLSTLPKNIQDRTVSAVPVPNQTKSFSASETIQKVVFSFNFYGSVSGTISKSGNFGFEFTFFQGQAPKAPVPVASKNPEMAPAPVPAPTI